MQPQYGFTIFCSQNCGVHTEKEQTDIQTDRKVKTEGL